jgi:hypothetical protein
MDVNVLHMELSIVNNFGNERIEDVVNDRTAMIRAFFGKHIGIKGLFEHVFVQIPQNVNYTIKNKKSNVILILTDGTWVENDKKDVLHAIMRKLSQIVADHHKEFGNGYKIPGKVAKSSVEYFCNLQQCLALTPVNRDYYVRLLEKSIYSSMLGARNGIKKKLYNLSDSEAD